MTLYEHILNFIESRHSAGQEWVSGLEIDDEMRAKFKKRTNAERRCREMSTAHDKNIPSTSRWYMKLDRDESLSYIRYRLRVYRFISPKPVQLEQPVMKPCICGCGREQKYRLSAIHFKAEDLLKINSKYLGQMVAGWECLEKLR